MRALIFVLVVFGILVLFPQAIDNLQSIIESIKEWE